MNPELHLRAAELHERSVQNRRGYEWKVNIGIWGVIVVASGFLANLEPEPWVVAVFALLSFGFAWLYGYRWLPLVLRGHKIDRDLKHYYLDRFDGVEREYPPVKSVTTTSLFTGDDGQRQKQWWWCYFGATVFFLAVGLCVISRNLISTPTSSRSSTVDQPDERSPVVKLQELELVLKQLRELVDANLITASDYDQKKQEYLQR